MKKIGLISLGLLAGIVIGFGIFSTLNQTSAAPSENHPLMNATASPASVSDEGNPLTANTDVNNDETPPPSLLSGEALNTLPTPVPGETLVYFVPTDNDATATIIYLYNTDTVAHIVALRGFSYNGVLVYSLNINVGATSFLRLASDSIASAPPPSWATPAPIITNFTDFTYFASLSLPKGVKAEGYTLFNPGTGVVDPRQDQGAMPLRFSTDPATMFLPTISNGSP
ncbi:MAG: hypothetical protein H6636_10145 [Anaerolineales bacterium]|nr:hypothetical protein [Anaerolineales bacterium]